MSGVSSEHIRITLFVKILEKFVEYLQDEFPMFSSELMLTKTTIATMKIATPKLLVDQVSECIIPYREQILECNDRFFLDPQNVNDLDASGVSIAKKVREIWVHKDTTVEQKANIWLYFHKLIKKMG